MLDNFEILLFVCCGFVIYLDNVYNCENLMCSVNSVLNYVKKIGWNIY